MAITTSNSTRVNPGRQETPEEPGRIQLLFGMRFEDKPGVAISPKQSNQGEIRKAAGLLTSPTETGRMPVLRALHVEGNIVVWWAEFRENAECLHKDVRVPDE